MKIPLLLCALAVMTLSSGCAFFHAPYGVATSEDIHQLVCRTDEVIADGEAGKLSLADSRQFLKQSQAQVQVMRLRYVGKEAKPHLDALDREYAVLLRQNHPLRRHTTSELRGTLFALQSLKPVRSVFYRETSSSIDDTLTDTTTNDTSSQKDCDKGRDHDHGGHDHGGHDCGCDHGHK